LRNNKLIKDIKEDIYLKDLTKKERKVLFCPTCKHDFYEKGIKKYCSIQCRKKAEQLIKESKKKRKYQEKNCIVCGKKFITHKYNHKFCSSKCNREFWLKKPFKKFCKKCNKPFITKMNTKLYCSKECSSRGYSMNHNNWLKLRFEILKRDNFTCQYCGRNVKEDGIKLHLDHIFPKSKGGKDEEHNLITSCIECNSGKSDILLENKIKEKQDDN